jgi:hypothetical protein
MGSDGGKTEMTTEEMFEIWEKRSDKEFLSFERVENKLSQRPDLHAFILMDKLAPGNKDIVSSAEHDEFWISIEPEDLAAVVTEEQIVDLIRCGLRYEPDEECFCFFA